MQRYSRREFFGKVGQGMLVSAGGLLVANELDLFGILHAGESDRLDFGNLEALASMMQETSADALMPKLRAQLDTGTDLRSLVAAAALANARTFGGQNYTGYHCFMAMVPALAMSDRLSGDRAALPVFKVLYRNTAQIQADGGRRAEVLRRIAPAPATTPAGDANARLLTAGRGGSFDTGEAALASIAAERGPQAAFAALQPLVRDNIDVHQVVLAYRSWDMRQVAGEQNAMVLLRQALRQCIERDESRRRSGRPAPSIRELLPRLVSEQGLDRTIPPATRLTEPELEDLAQSIFAASRDDAAAQVAAMLGRGVSREDVGEALSLAAVRLLLHDPGRSRGEPGKPAGSIHGASVGLHAADSANAWRGIATATDASNANACLVTAAWHTAGQSGGMSKQQPYHADARETAAALPAPELLGAVNEAIRGRDQKLSCALAERYGKLGGNADDLLAVLIEPAIQDDGALHHEKFFHTATVEFARSRPENRWDHLVALTRVMASGYGIRAEGLDVARQALEV